MGAWGHGSFDNDDASDWVYELEETDSLDLLATTLASAANGDEYLEAPTASCAIAAAEVVAALSGRPSPNLPSNLQTWLAAHPLKPSQDLLVTGARALDRIVTDSELRELWDESDEAAAWVAEIADLRRRLAP